MKRPRNNSDPLETQAAAWIARRDRGLTPAEDSEFRAWRAAHPSHDAALKALGAMWDAFDCAGEADSPDLLRAHLQRLEARDRRRWRVAGSAVALAAACFAGAMLLPFSPPVPAGAVAEAGRIRVTEPERQMLPDGSLVEYSPGTRLEVDFGADSRRVVLRQGVAQFTVVPNPAAPFTVAAGAVRIRAVGTAFAVQYDTTEVEVVVTEGSVSVTPPPAEPPPIASGAAPAPERPAPPAPLLVQGQRAVVALGGVPAVPLVKSLSAEELNERLAWRLPRLDFSETTLAEAIGMFRRYSGIELHAGDATVAAMRVTGVFRADNVEGFVRAVEATFEVAVERRSDGAIVLRARR